MGVIPELPFLWMTERQRQELRPQVSRIVADFAMAVARSRRRRLLRKLRSAGAGCVRGASCAGDQMPLCLGDCDRVCPRGKAKRSVG